MILTAYRHGLRASELTDLRWGLCHGRLVSGHGGALLKTTRIASNRFTGMANRLPLGLAAILRPSMRPTWKAISENGTN
jgi:hypothetical protein